MTGGGSLRVKRLNEVGEEGGDGIRHRGKRCSFEEKTSDGGKSSKHAHEGVSKEMRDPGVPSNRPRRFSCDSFSTLTGRGTANIATGISSLYSDSGNAFSAEETNTHGECGHVCRRSQSHQQLSNMALNMLHEEQDVNVGHVERNAHVDVKVSPERALQVGSQNLPSSGSQSLDPREEELDDYLKNMKLRSSHDSGKRIPVKPRVFRESSCSQFVGGDDRSTLAVSSRERLHAFRAEVAGKTQIPESWHGEEELKGWVEWATVDRALRPQGLLAARTEMMMGVRGGIARVEMETSN